MDDGQGQAAHRRSRRRPDRAHPRRQRRRASAGAARGRRRREPEAARALAEATGAAGRARSTPIIEAATSTPLVICTPTDTHADLIERAARPARRSSARSRSTSTPSAFAPACDVVAADRRGAHDRLQPPLRPELRGARAARIARRARSARSRSSRSCPATPPRRRRSYAGWSGGLFRDMMIHDFDMARFLLGEEPVEVHAVGVLPGRPGDRRRRRRRHRRRAAEDGVRQDRADLQLAPRHLRLRPAHRGARFARAAERRQPHATTTVESPIRAATRPTRRCPSSSSATRRPIGPSSTRSWPRYSTRRRWRPPAWTASGRRGWPTPRPRRRAPARPCG